MFFHHLKNGCHIQTPLMLSFIANDSKNIINCFYGNRNDRGHFSCRRFIVNEKDVCQEFNRPKCVSYNFVYYRHL